MPHPVTAIMSAAAVRPEETNDAAAAVSKTVILFVRIFWKIIVPGFPEPPMSVMDVPSGTAALWKNSFITPGMPMPNTAVLCRTPEKVSI